MKSKNKFSKTMKNFVFNNQVFEIQSIFFENLCLHEKSFMDFSAQKIASSNFLVIKFPLNGKEI